jgi:hypothetical protein
MTTANSRFLTNVRNDKKTKFNNKLILSKMKKKLFLIVLLVNTTFTFAQKIYTTPQVDERVELMSIVFRLAGAREYVTNKIPMYVDEVDKYFEKYKSHPLIKYSTTLLNKYDVSYDAVAQFAIFLEIKKSNIIFRKDIKIENLDDRWQRDSIPKYIVLLNDFYKKTKFHDFFVENKKIREIAEENFAKEVTDKIDFDWFNKFFGYLPEKKFHIIISLANGPNHYGPNIVYKNGEKEFFAIIGSWQADENGYPTYKDKNRSTESTLIHEISHSFCNPLVFEYQNELLPQAVIFYNLNKNKLLNLGYGGANIFLYEILVRACVIIYESEHKQEYYNEKNKFTKEIDRGFLYIPQLVNVLKEYRNDRINNKTLRDFMPEIVKFQNSLDPQQLYDEIENQKPIITGTNMPNGCDSVDYNLDHISVYFNKPMLIGSNGTIRGEYAFPKFIDKPDKWDEEGTKWTFFVELEPDTQYQIVFLNLFFIDSDNFYNPKNNYILTFKTRKKE